MAENFTEKQASENSSENRRDTMRSVLGKLLNLAMHEGTPEHEAAAAMSRATEIMVKYNIVQSEAIRSENVRIEDTMIEAEESTFYKFRSQSWEATLGNGIAKAFDCQIMLRKASDWGGENDKIVFVGNNRDIADVLFFFGYLRMMVGGEARKRYKKIGDRQDFAAGASTRIGDRQDFAAGASTRIGDRLGELYKLQAKMLPGDTMALVIVKKGAVSTYIKKKYPKMGTFSAKSVRNGGAYSSGGSYGNTVGLSKGHSAPAPQQLNG